MGSVPGLKAFLSYNTGQTIRVYLDNCCYNRPFDEQTQLRVRHETEAKMEILALKAFGDVNAERV